MCGIYDELKLANQCEEEIQQDYFKPKVKKLLELYRKSRGIVKNMKLVNEVRLVFVWILSVERKKITRNELKVRKH